MKNINTNNPVVFIGLVTIGVIVAGLILHHGKKMPIIKDAKKGF